MALAEEDAVMKFKFPQPGAIEGVKSRSKVILRMNGVTFQLPSENRAAISDVSLTLSQVSRVAILGTDDAERSAAVSLLLGEQKPTEGTIWEARGLRKAYLAQSTFSDMDNHMQETPTEYIIRRFFYKEGKDSSMIRQLTQPSIEKHFGDFGVDSESASQKQIKDLSNMMKVRVVMAAAMWRTPHILILDDPTSYLDRGVLDALVRAIQEYKGAVLVISHSEDFCEGMDAEKWVMKDGRLFVEGEAKEVKPEENLSSDANEDTKAGQAEGRTPGMDRRFFKREIKQIEGKIKQCKKVKDRSRRELLELAERLESLKNELAKLDRTVLMSMQVKRNSSDEKTPPVTLALGDRISLQGLSQREVSDLCNYIGGSCAGSSGEHVSDIVTWQIWKESGVLTRTLSSTDAAFSAQELQDRPHVVCLLASGNRISSEIVAMLRNVKDTVVLIEDPDDSAMDERAVACLLHTIGIKERWCVSSSSALERVELPRLLRGETIGDLKLRDVKENGKFAEFWDELECLYPQHFDDDLIELLNTDGVRLGLLLSVLEKGDEGKQREFLGFIIYTFWGPPLKTMSISRVAVPQKFRMHGFGRQLVRWVIDKAKQKPCHDCCTVSLLATPEAITFYKRLNFTQMPDDEVHPHDCQGKMWVEYHLGRAGRH